MPEIQNKQQMLKYLENILNGDIYEKFGVYKVDFCPFEGNHTQEQCRLVDFINDDDVDDDAEISVTKEDLQDAMQANKSTIFHGMRFYFYSYKALKKFCEIVEKNNRTGKGSAAGNRDAQKGISGACRQRQNDRSRSRTPDRSDGSRPANIAGKIRTDFILRGEA